MNSLEISVSFFLNFFLLLFPGLVTCRTNCLTPLSCGDEGPRVRFPFRLEGHHSEVCGYPGFNLACISSNKTILELPLSGKFIVRNIYYNLRVIQIYDSDNCLPRSLLNLSLLGSPYQLDGRNEKFTFLNCSSASIDLSNISSLYIHIHCLSSSTHTILATNVTTHRIQPLNSICAVIATVSAPVVSTLDGYSNQIRDVLRLTWSPTAADDSQGTIRRRMMFVVFGICIGLPILIFFICYYCPWVIRSYRDEDHRLFVAVLPQSNDRLIFSSFGYQPSFIAARGYQPSFIAARGYQPSFIAGLDSSIIDSYPKILLDEKLRLPNPNDTTCSICLSEYLPTETLKIIPSCNHYFHSKCIDQWLSMSSTCPVCRESQSLQSLLPSP
ncbi:hypothetical protein MKX01_031399 [Papaver californicum]|nr:hypothetical protein MKX01_031399 [Papaver californicum]